CPASDIGGEIVRLRSIKTEAEINMISESGKLGSGALRRTIEQSAAGHSELEIDDYGNQFLFDEVSRNYTDSTLDYFVMSPSGVRRTNMPHVFSNTRRLEAGDVVIHSRQVGLSGYRAECERTFFVGGPTDRQREV